LLSAVADHLRLMDSTCLWDIEFSRSFEDWEWETVNSFMDILYSCYIRLGSLDSVCWRPSRRKVFEVRSYYSILLKPSRSFFSWKSVWNSKVPTRVAFFTWTVALDRIFTVDNLRKTKGSHHRLVQHV
jgi:hypothetical protein